MPSTTLGRTFATVRQQLVISCLILALFLLPNLANALGSLEKFKAASCATIQQISDKLKCNSFVAPSSASSSGDKLAPVLTELFEDDSTLGTKQTWTDVSTSGTCRLNSRRADHTMWAAMGPAVARLLADVNLDRNLHVLRSYVRSRSELWNYMQLPRVVSSVAGTVSWPNPPGVPLPPGVTLDPTVLMPNPIPIALFKPGIFWQPRVGLVPPPAIPTVQQQRPLTKPLVHAWRNLNSAARKFIRKCAWWGVTAANYPWHDVNWDIIDPASGGGIQIPPGVPAWNSQNEVTNRLPATVAAYLQTLRAHPANPVPGQFPWLWPNCEILLFEFAPIVPPPPLGAAVPGVPATLNDYIDLWWYEQWEVEYGNAFYQYSASAAGAFWINKHEYSPRLLTNLATLPNPNDFDGSLGDVWFIDGWYYVTDAAAASGYRLILAGGIVLWDDMDQGLTTGQVPGSIAPSDFIVATSSAGMSIFGLPAGLQANDLVGDVTQHVDAAGHVRANVFGGRGDPLNFVPLGAVANSAWYGGAESMVRAIMTACPCTSQRVTIEFQYQAPAALRPILWRFRSQFLADVQRCRGVSRGQPQFPIAPNPRCAWEGNSILPNTVVVDSTGLNLPN